MDNNTYNKKEPYKETLPDKLMTKMPFAIWVILLCLPVLLIVFGIVAVWTFAEQATTNSFYLSFILSLLLPLLFIILAVVSLFRKNFISAIAMVVICAFFISPAIDRGLDLPYLEHPCTKTLTNTSLKTTVSFDADNHSIHGYALVGYDENGNKQQMQITLSQYENYSSISGSAVVYYLPHTGKVMRIEPID